jgi:hypothetical protein
LSPMIDDITCIVVKIHRWTFLYCIVC